MQTAPLPPTGTPVEWIEEESYFFRLSAYQDRLLAHYADNPDLQLTGWSTGDRVQVIAAIPCGTCEVCQRGWMTVCPNQTAIGYHFDGARIAGSSMPCSTMTRSPTSAWTGAFHWVH